MKYQFTDGAKEAVISVCLLVICLLICVCSFMLSPPLLAVGILVSLIILGAWLDYNDY